MMVVTYMSAFTPSLKPPDELLRQPLLLLSQSLPKHSSFKAPPSTIRLRRRFRNRTAVVAAFPARVPIMWPQDPLMIDICATGVTAAAALGFLRLSNETAKRGIFDQKLNRKLVHICVGLIFLICWPMFSSEYRGAALASLIPGVNILRLLMIGLGIRKDDATVQSISRFGDYRELLKGPLYYACTVTFACLYYWRSSPIGIGAICNLCAGDGLADIVGRRFGEHKLPYNKSKSVVGSITMAGAGFLVSVMFMYYFSLFGFIPVSGDIMFGYFCMSIASALVESLPISTELDDNLTVPITSVLIGSLFFSCKS